MLASRTISDLRQPCFSLSFAYDRQDFDSPVDHVVEYPNIANPKPVLRSVEFPKPLDAATADLCRLVAKMNLKCRPND
jgi:hypothetical protein